MLTSPITPLGPSALTSKQRKNLQTTAKEHAAPKRALIDSKSTVPTAESLKAFYLSTKTLKKPISIRFGAGPSPDEITRITAGLSGWPGNETIIAPSYFPTAEAVEALRTAIFSEQEIPQQALQKLAQHKVRAQNIHNLFLNKPAVKESNFAQDTLNFVNEFKTRMGGLNNFLQNEGLPDSAIDLFNRYALYTAPVLFSMGFPDAVAHAADVAQLTYLQAKKHGANETEALQALMVGWLHDPKLPGAISWSNLATHPVVASSIAKHTLEQPDIRSALNTYAFDPEFFKEGIVEALSINNDSKWVLDNVILHKATYIPLAEPGVADANPENTNEEARRNIETIFNNRFVAPSEGRELPAFPLPLMNELNQTELSTDLRGLQYDKLPEEFKTLHTRSAIAKLLDGTEADQALWEQAQRIITEQPGHYAINPKVKGGSLTSHHMEMEKAPLAALGLAIADPLLLSPHKVMAQTAGSTVLARIASFVNSFDNNIRFLPKEAQDNGKTWRNQVLLSMLAASDALTGNRLLEDDMAIIPLLQDDEALKNKVLSPETWRGPQGNFDTVPPDAETFGQVLNALKSHYEKAVKDILLIPPSRKTEPLLLEPCTELHRRNSAIRSIINAQGTIGLAGPSERRSQAM
jgi:hypothetical protein